MYNKNECKQICRLQIKIRLDGKTTTQAKIIAEVI